MSSHPHASHWGAFRVLVEGDGVSVEPHPRDPDPAPYLKNLEAAPRNPARIRQPAVRAGWLARGPGPDERRGEDRFVPISWPDVLDRLTTELLRVREGYGPQAIYGGSYGWSSAGRFHHAQSQVHRFLNSIGGYVRSVNTYSAGASAVILPHVVGSLDDVQRNGVTWEDLARTELLVAFGGMAAKNAMVSGGGVGRHVVRGELVKAAHRGAEVVYLSPLRDDMPDDLLAHWQPLRPGTDTAVMLGIAHRLLSEGVHDAGFLERYCTGFDRFARYLLGETDGRPKDAAWASRISGVPAAVIVDLARRMARRRTLITVSHSLQRAEHGEQPIWMGLVLAAMLGQIGLDGGGYAYALGALANVGKPPLAVPIPTLPQGHNPVAEFIPVARVADMLLDPGGTFDYDGKTMVYPRIRLVYWAGGNPFHHHQDLNRLQRAFGRADTIVVHESVWTATARHADIVLPTTITMERDDIGAAANDPFILAMHRVVEPFAEALDDYEIFSRLAARLEVADEFTEGRTSHEWIRHLFEQLRLGLREVGAPAPTFEEFWEKGELELPRRVGPNLWRRLRESPEPRLATPSGRIEIFSETIAGFGYDDCPGHPVWIAPDEWSRRDRYPLQLVANQPASRLHSQLDFGAVSQATKVNGREPIRILAADAAARGVRGGDVVRVFNDRGACLAGAVLSEDVTPGVVQMATGAWYQPFVDAEGRPLCLHGNPNVLTRDRGTSRLAQGCTGQLCHVQVERCDHQAPPTRPYRPPGIQTRPPHRGDDP